MRRVSIAGSGRRAQLPSTVATAAARGGHVDPGSRPAVGSHDVGGGCRLPTRRERAVAGRRFHPPLVNRPAARVFRRSGGAGIPTKAVLQRVPRGLRATVHRRRTA